ncbi:hypothetical protein P12x_000444 [Tundrisphaera lichenicola]|uniref:hypothetical protein n=1 Tax=Tundrisphaera lichenicola TaxID=2029860 RepID=UPI003EBA27CE
MPVSEARLIANRANARHSTGPRTPEGKARSRANGLKHGLTGEGVVLPAEDLGEVEALAVELEAELKPSGPMGRILVRRIAVLSVRMDRSVRQESAAIARKVRHAEADFDDRATAEVDHLYDWITAEPAANARRLRRSPEGVDRMLREWAALRADLTHPTRDLWSFTHLDKAENMTGRRMEDLPASRMKALSKAIWGDFSYLEDHEVAGLDERERRAWAAARLVELIDIEMEKLRAHRETLDPDAFALDRAEAADRALFDPSHEATLARKYEAAVERGLYRALRELREVEANSEAETLPAPEAEAEGLGSSLPDRKDDPEGVEPGLRETPRRSPGPPFKSGEGVVRGEKTPPGPD